PYGRGVCIVAFCAKLAAAQDDQVVGRLGSQASIDNSDYAGRAQRSMLTTSAPGSSGGINPAPLRRGARARGAGAIASAGKPGGARPVAGDVGVAGRTDEEIQIVFDRYKSA